MIDDVKTLLQKSRIDVLNWTPRNIEETSDERAISLNEIHERCNQACQDVREVWDSTFGEMFISTMTRHKMNFRMKCQGGQISFYGIRFRNDNPTTRRERSAGRSAQDSTGSRFPTSSYGVLKKHIMSAPDSMVSVTRLKKLYEAVISEGDIPFSEFLEDMLDKNQDLSRVTKTNENSAKSRKYINGLALTERGKKLLAEIK
jgi:hypothetical protein